MRFLFVIVIYELPLSKCKSYQNLLSILSKQPLNYEILLYDNSLNAQSHLSLPNSTIYVHNPLNPGTAQAYNFGIKKAQELGADWIVLLDQDTQITKDYLTQAITACSNLNDRTVAMVPKMYNKERQISPTKANTLNNIRHPLSKSGLYKTDLTAISSGSWVRLSFLQDINGFNEEFPLDYLDHWFFFFIFKQRKQVLVLDTTLQHDLSVLSMDTLAIDRYKQIIYAENKFFSTYNKKFYIPYKMHLALRFFKQLLMVKNKKIALMTFLSIFKLPPKKHT